MSFDPNSSNEADQEPVILEARPTNGDHSSALEGLDEIQRETKALIDAITHRAQAEAYAAGEFTRETYLKVVRQAREAVEQNQLFKPDELEKSIDSIQKEAEKNWNALVTEVNELGDRLSEAAKAAWEKLMQDQAPKP
jgi:vacuolar-type H+-ATPase subunit E/Vma4